MKPRLHVYNEMLRTGIVPVFYIADRDKAVQFVGQCVAGGLRALEMTNRGEAALRVFEQLRHQFPDVILGIGSIADAPTAALFLAHGADFVVGPYFDADVASLCNSRKVAYIPGCSTPTEIHNAEINGAEIVKLFPASVYGPGFIKAVLAPSPQTRIMPTGGVQTTEASVREWVEAGACCLGVGSSLTKVDDVAETCRQMLGWFQQYRREPAL